MMVAARLFRLIRVCGISRNTFYKLRRWAVDEGEAAVLESRSRRPASSPTRISDERVVQALRVRVALASSGLDAGPVSVCDKMALMGLDAPFPSSLARVFREACVARADPAKRPRAVAPQQLLTDNGAAMKTPPAGAAKGPWSSTCAPWAWRRSPANPTTPPPRARTSVSARP